MHSLDGPLQIISRLIISVARFSAKYCAALNQEIYIVIIVMVFVDNTFSKLFHYFYAIDGL